MGGVKKAGKPKLPTLPTRIKRKSLGSLRKKILERDNYTCQICYRKLPPNQLIIDHIIPVSFGGTDDEHNLRVVCKECHKLLASAPYWKEA
ncbi:MAG: HNH endonuclease signature motif containing protein [Candidatus Pacearchaeota archaeon]